MTTLARGLGISLSVLVAASVRPAGAPRRRCANRTALLDPLVVRVLSFDFKAVAITVG